MTNYEDDETPAGLNPLLRNWLIIMSACVTVAKMTGHSWADGVELGVAVIVALHVALIGFVFVVALLGALVKGGSHDD